jgi:hypothetical protein
MVNSVEYMTPADQEKRRTPHLDLLKAMKIIPTQYTSCPQTYTGLALREI